jgi:2-polyprenyl-6-methoxyphenol hydroxylase-like FAD-dependent oxidoreductase
MAIPAGSRSEIDTDRNTKNAITWRVVGAVSPVLSDLAMNIYQGLRPHDTPVPVITVADFSRLSTTCKFLVFMPQWDFLDFMAECGRRYRGFRLMMKMEATDLIEEGGRIVGVRANAQAGAVEIRADLTISADGRHSTLRDRAGFRVDDLGAPMDVLWMRLSRRPDDDADPFGHFEAGSHFGHAEPWQ